MKRCCYLLALALVSACGNRRNPDNAGTEILGTWSPPGPGIVVAADSMKTDDPLNDFYFSVKLIVSSDNEGANGDYGFVYDISTHYGPGNMTGKLTMPAGGRSLKPILRRDPQGGYKYIIGFIAGKDMGGDGRTFQEFYSVTGTKEMVEIKPLKSYRFQ